MNNGRKKIIGDVVELRLKVLSILEYEWKEINIQIFNNTVRFGQAIINKHRKVDAMIT